MLEATSQLATVVLQSNVSFPLIPAQAAAALAVGLAALGAGYAERGIGAAAVGAVAEDDDMFVRGLILTVLPETLVILALVTLFLTTGIPWTDVSEGANFIDLMFSAVN